MQDFDTRFQLRVPCKSNYTGIDLVIDCRLRFKAYRSLHISQHNSGLSVLRVTTIAFPQRFRFEAICLGMAAVVAVANLDYFACLDAEMRTSRFHREIVRCTYVQLIADRSIDGLKQEKGWSTGSESGGNQIRSFYNPLQIFRISITLYNVICKLWYFAIRFLCRSPFLRDDYFCFWNYFYFSK